MEQKKIDYKSDDQGKIVDFIGMKIDRSKLRTNDGLESILKILFPPLIKFNGKLPGEIKELIELRNQNDDFYSSINFNNNGKSKNNKFKRRFSEDLSKIIINNLRVEIEGDQENWEIQKRIYTIFNELSKIKSCSEFKPPKLDLNEQKFQKMKLKIEAVYSRRILFENTTKPDIIADDIWAAKKIILDEKLDGINLTLAYKLFNTVFNNIGENQEFLLQLSALAVQVADFYKVDNQLVIERCGSGYGHAEACNAGCSSCSLSPENFDNSKILSRPPSIPPQIMVADAVWKMKYNDLDHYKIVLGVGKLRYGSAQFNDAIKIIKESNRKLSRELGSRYKNSCASLGVVTDERIVEVLKSEGIEIERYNANFECPEVYYDGKAYALYEDGSTEHLKPFSMSHCFNDKLHTFKLMQKAGINSCSGVLIEKIFPEKNKNGSRLIKVITEEGHEYSNQLIPYLDLFKIIKDLGLPSAPFNARVQISTDHMNRENYTESEYTAMISLFKLIYPNIGRIILNAGPESAGTFLPIALKIGQAISAGGNYLTSGLTEEEREIIINLLNKYE